MSEECKNLYILIEGSVRGEAEVLDIGKYNSVINNFKNNVRRAGKANIERMSGKSTAIRSVKSGKPLSQNLKSRTRKDFGEIFMIGYQFPRHGVFFHKGVGRGWHMQGGKVVRVAKGQKKADRKPKEWLNPEIDKRLPKLADDLVELKADAAVNATRAKIN